MQAVDTYSLTDCAGRAPFAAYHMEFDRGIDWYRRTDYCSIVLVEEGHGSTATSSPDGRRSSALASGHLVFLRPWDMTALRPGFVDSHVSFSVAHWRSFVQLTELDSVERYPGPACVQLDETAGHVARAFDRAIQRFQDSPTVLDLVEFWAAVVPMLLAPRASSERESDTPAWLVHALGAMRHEWNLHAGVVRLAEIAHVSTGYLATMTRRHYGRTPATLVAEIRLRHAAQLLRTTPAPIMEIAGRCGFRSLAHFSNRFHREFGVSPRQYRSRLEVTRHLQPS